MFGKLFGGITHAHKRIYSTELVARMGACSCPNVITDTEYLAVSDDFLDAVNVKYRRNISRWGLKYSEKWDCDDYAIAYYSLARRMFAQDKTTVAQAPALGCLVHRVDVREYHMLNFRLDENLTPEIIEPQEIVDYQRYRKDANGRGLRMFMPPDPQYVKYIIV
jgi:hypothetical protein